MEEGKRQKQISGLLNEEMNIIFQRLGLNMIDGGMVSISSVKVTPDLLEARFYLSFFQVKDVKGALKKIEDRYHEIKKELASLVERAGQACHRLCDILFSAGPQSAYFPVPGNL